MPKLRAHENFGFYSRWITILKYNKKQVHANKYSDNNNNYMIHNTQTWLTEITHWYLLRAKFTNWNDSYFLVHETGRGRDVQERIIRGRGRRWWRQEAGFQMIWKNNRKSLSLLSFKEFKLAKASLRPIFTARCTLVQSAVLRSHVVCLSVRLWRWWIVIT